MLPRSPTGPPPNPHIRLPPPRSPTTPPLGPQIHLPPRSPTGPPPGPHLGHLPSAIIRQHGRYIASSSDSDFEFVSEPEFDSDEIPILVNLSYPHQLLHLAFDDINILVNKEMNVEEIIDKSIYFISVAYYNHFPIDRDTFVMDGVFKDYANIRIIPNTYTIKFIDPKTPEIKIQEICEYGLLRKLPRELHIARIVKVGTREFNVHVVKKLGKSMHRLPYFDKESDDKRKTAKAKAKGRKRREKKKTRNKRKSVRYVR
jgi:hypothetical protein